MFLVFWLKIRFGHQCPLFSCTFIVEKGRNKQAFLVQLFYFVSVCRGIRNHVLSIIESSKI